MSSPRVPRTAAQYHADRKAESEACVGQTFGCFRVVGISHLDPHFGTFVHVVCGCGEPDTRRLSSLKNGAPPKLGCRECRHLRTAMRLYPFRGDARPLWQRVMAARGQA